MSTSDSLIAWFDQQIDTLPLTPTWTVLTDFVTVDNFSISEHTSCTADEANPSFLTLLENPPFGITQYKLRYRHVPLRRSGPAGWTYYPADSNGTRLARVSYSSLTPNVYITAMVKLINHAKDDETESWTVSEYAVVSIDNLTAHGKVEMRKAKSENKRRKLCIHH